MSGLLGKIPKLTLKLPTSLAKAGKSMSECPLELSFAICEDNSWRKLKEEQPETLSGEGELKSPTRSKMENFNIFEKGDEEKSEKDDNMEVTCSVSVDGQEKQEFSFTLYDLDAKEKVSKQDMEKIVVRSICEALGKTLKLPPSGSRTIKVKLAISPDSSKDLDTQELSNEWKNATSEQPSPEKSSPCKVQDYDSSKSANTVSTYLLSSTTEKQPPQQNNTCECASPSIAANLATRETKHLMSPKFRAVRHSRLISLHKQEHPSYRSNPKDHRKKLFEENLHENRPFHGDVQKGVDDTHEPNQKSRDHVPESRERRNHYLDLAGIENDSNNVNGISHKTAASYMDSGLTCPYRILDRSHVCSKPSRTRNGLESPAKKSPIANHSKLNICGSGHHHATEAAQGLRTQTMRDNLLNLNLDLCDIIPDAKFDWEKIPHRRSKSHDMHMQMPGMVHSPKVRQKHAQNLAAAAAMESQKYHCGGNSPVHNLRMRHRDKDRQRAMQQVANWIAKEHSQEKVENETHFLTGGFVKSPEVAEKHEHHHVHEHIHHHYHHFVDF